MAEAPPRSFTNPASGKVAESSYLNLEEAHARATELFAQYEIKPEKFAGMRGYPDAEIRTDTEDVRRREKNFKYDIQSDFADILEAIAFEHGELSEWFGPTSKVIKTSRYDDYFNRVDLVVETEAADQEYSHLALGMDVTFGGDLHKKFAGIRAKIDQGRLGQVKYFLSDRPDKIFAGPLHNIPEVVVGVEIDRVRELALLWMNKKNKQLGEHPVQRMILREIALQLKTFAAYARHIGKDDLAVILETELQTVEALMKEKRGAGIEVVEQDKVFEEIKLNLAAFENPQ
ncbi:MAG: hypothetical protein Q8L52_02230 [bacterium]|nr:hypothetical protein [bacterium]